MSRVICVIVLITISVKTSYGKYEECGRVNGGDGLILQGESVKLGEVPWHAGIYDTRKTPYLQICGGSIVSRIVVISAAHCFADETEISTYSPRASDYALAVGKIYRPWNETHDPYAQKSKINNIYLTGYYFGSLTSVQQDIAVIIASTPFQYNPYVRAICVNFNSHLEYQQLQEGNKGKVAGWGWTEKRKPSPVLKATELEYVSPRRCFKEAPFDFKSFITADKFCAGGKNVTTVCKGDSGGGLAFPARDKNGLRYYLRGLVSTAPTSEIEEGCNNFAYAAFTQISKHQAFITQYLKMDTSRRQDTSNYAECGITTPEDVELVPGSSTVTIGQTPWHAVIYDKLYGSAHGGSIITSKFIVTEATSLWLRSKFYGPQYYDVTVGKVYRDLRDNGDDMYVQRFDIINVYLPPGNDGFKQFDRAFRIRNIGILELSAEIEFTKYVRPICLSFEHALQLSQIVHNNKGKLAAWDHSSGVSPELGTVEFSNIHRDTCDDILPPYRRNIAEDSNVTICARNPVSMEPFCDVDLGTGIAFPVASTDGEPTKYYLLGIVIDQLVTTPNNDTCWKTEYTVMTTMYIQKDFVNSVILK